MNPRTAPPRWLQNPAQHKVIRCPDRGCDAPLKVPTPATTVPTVTTCEGTFPHTWAVSILATPPVGEGL